MAYLPANGFPYVPVYTTGTLLLASIPLSLIFGVASVHYDVRFVCICIIIFNFYICGISASKRVPSCTCVHYGNPFTCIYTIIFNFWCSVCTLRCPIGLYLYHYFKFLHLWHICQQTGSLMYLCTLREPVYLHLSVR